MATALTSAADVMLELGGIQAVADMTGRNYKAAANWKSFNAFPPDTFVVMTAELAKRGKRAPESLWRMVERRASA